MSDDPYAALGLSKSASQDDIKKAYRRIAKTSHPDLNPDDPKAEERFKAASAAYELLSDPEQRARYDRGEIDASGQERPERQFYRRYAEQAGNPYRQGAQYKREGTFEDFGDFEGFAGFTDASDIFARFFGGRAGPGAGGGTAGGFAARGQDRQYRLEVDFLEAARGATKRITLPDGDTLDVKIPEGTRDGQTIRLRGKGGSGMGGGAAGDAHVTVSVRPHKLFRREGDDIHVTVPVALDEAVLGGNIAVPTIDGTVSLNVPKGSSGGRQLRLRGRGVKKRGGGRGDQIVELRLQMPDRIDDDLAAFMQDWRKQHGYNPREGMQT